MYQRELEDQIAVWKQKHEALAKSHVSQTEEVSQLKAQIDDLNAQVMSLQFGSPDMWGYIEKFQQDFDLVPH